MYILPCFKALSDLQRKYLYIIIYNSINTLHCKNHLNNQMIISILVVWRGGGGKSTILWLVSVSPIGIYRMVKLSQETSKISKIINGQLSYVACQRGNRLAVLRE